MSPRQSMLMAIVLINVAALTACSTVRVDSVEPGIDLESLTIQPSGLEINLLVENRNDQPILLQATALELSLDDRVILDLTAPLNLQIGPRGRESLVLTTTPKPGGQQALEAIEQSAAYRMVGRLEFESLRTYRLEQEGFLHPVPGQPGRYR